MARYTKTKLDQIAQHDLQCIPESQSELLREALVELAKKALMTSTVALLMTAGALPQEQEQAVITLPVKATMDIWRAGGYNDGSDGMAPAVYSFAARQGRILTFARVNGAWSCAHSVTRFSPDGTSAGVGCLPGNISSAGTFSGYDLTDLSSAMVGMFLEDTLPPATPPSLRFYDTNNSQGGIATDFKILSPLIGQVFFIGDGLTGTGTGSMQVFRVPATATHLYLGFADSCSSGTPGCYFDNTGTLEAIFRVSRGR